MLLYDMVNDATHGFVVELARGSFSHYNIVVQQFLVFEADAVVRVPFFGQEISQYSASLAVFVNNCEYHYFWKS